MGESTLGERDILITEKQNNHLAEPPLRGTRQDWAGDLRHPAELIISFKNTHFFLEFVSTIHADPFYLVPAGGPR